METDITVNTDVLATNASQLKSQSAELASLPEKFAGTLMDASAYGAIVNPLVVPAVALLAEGVGGFLRSKAEFMQTVADEMGETAADYEHVEEECKRLVQQLIDALENI